MKRHVSTGPDMIARNLFHESVVEAKRAILTEALTQAGGNRTKAARVLGMQRTYLLRLIRQYGIRVPAPVSVRRLAAAATARGQATTSGVA